MSDCLFCRISSGEIPSRQAYSDERVYAFHDISPKAPTHVLVIPRKHIPKLADAGPADRELVGELVARAASIARDLGLSPKTVDNHIQSIYSKLGVKTRGGATLFALERGLLQPRKT